MDELDAIFGGDEEPSSSPTDVPGEGNGAEEKRNEGENGDHGSQPEVLTAVPDIPTLVPAQSDDVDVSDPAALEEQLESLAPGELNPAANCNGIKASMWSFQMLRY